jgi:glycerol-3-phosphate dehydrogenase (NAD(P)+)
LSRNYTVGKKLGGGMTIDDILAETRTVAEGVKTTRSVFNLSKRLGVELPICNEVYHIIYDKLSPEETVGRLMTRSLKHELD